MSCMSVLVGALRMSGELLIVAHCFSSTPCFDRILGGQCVLPFHGQESKSPILCFPWPLRPSTPFLPPPPFHPLPFQQDSRRSGGAVLASPPPQLSFPSPPPSCSLFLSLFFHKLQQYPPLGDGDGVCLLSVFWQWYEPEITEKCQLPMGERSVKVCATGQWCTILSMLECVLMHVCMG